MEVTTSEAGELSLLIKRMNHLCCGAGGPMASTGCS